MESFSYTYSAPDHQEVLRIRDKYLPQQKTPVEQLRQLDGQVRKPAVMFGLIYGCVSALIMGAGMSLVMTDLGDTLGIAQPMVAGVVIGILGMLMALTTYGIYKSILHKRKEKFAPQILALSEQIMKN